MSEGLGEWDDEPGVVVEAEPDFADEAEGEDLEAERAPESPALYYPTVEAFVSGLLAPTYRRSLGGHGVAWCPYWWRHAEAIARLEAIWRAWEHLRLDPATGISVWFRDHCDPHMAVLLSPDGPFRGCSPDKGHGERRPPLPVEAAPTGLFKPATEAGG